MILSLKDFLSNSTPLILIILYKNTKSKYEELDKTWREKYKARFFESGNTNSSNPTTPTEVKKEQEEDVKDDSESIDFGDLFAEREG